MTAPTSLLPLPIAPTAGNIAARWQQVQHAVAAAAHAANRATDSVQIVAVSKTHPAAAVSAAADAGATIFGENYVQELVAKQTALAARQLRWHFIGQLQRNKVKAIAGRVALIHGVDSLALAQAIAHHVPTAAPQPVLLAVNIGGEASKSGVAPDAARELAAAMLRLPQLSLRGFMTLPPPTDDLVLTQARFGQLRALRDQLAASLGVPLPELSMGMSGDFAQAIAEGATLVRVGTAIFGDRAGRR